MLAVLIMLFATIDAATPVWLASTAQQLPMSFGVAAPSVSTARMSPPPERGGELARRLAR